MKARHSPWKLKAEAFGNRGLLGNGKAGPDTDFRQLRQDRILRYLRISPLFCLRLRWLLPRVQILRAPTLIRQ
ncbi:unnamed protein product [Coregonus sp. 'balchen']|nr:unnamed protein product [Coregonus sp. 'balchen']